MLRSLRKDGLDLCRSSNRSYFDSSFTCCLAAFLLRSSSSWAAFLALSSCAALSSSACCRPFRCTGNEHLV